MNAYHSITLIYVRERERERIIDLKLLKHQYPP